MWLSKVEWEAICNGKADMLARLEKLEELVGVGPDEILSNHDSRIVQLEESYKRGSLKSDEPESVQIDPGHVPFSQRKRNYEAAKRMEAANKKKGPQPAKGT